MPTAKADIENVDRIRLQKTFNECKTFFVEIFLLY